jgi:hypothetical protein
MTVMHILFWTGFIVLQGYMLECYFRGAWLKKEQATTVVTYNVVAWWAVLFVRRRLFGTGGFIGDLVSFALGSLAAYVSLNLMGEM